MPVGATYQASAATRTDFIEDANGRVHDSATCGNPTYRMTSTPAGAEAFVVLDQVKGEFTIRPRTADHMGSFTIRITQDLSANLTLI